VDAVWSSPLARCVQTALLALQPLVGPQRAIELKPNARERRELSNLSTSIGNSCGEHIRTRSLAKLRELHKTVDQSTRSQVEALRLTADDVEGPWWSTNPEPEKEFGGRISELLTQVQYAEEASIALVAHSDTLHELLTHHVHEEAREVHAGLLQQLTSRPPRPCSLVYMRLDFRTSTPITEVLLLGDALRQAAGQRPQP